MPAQPKDVVQAGRKKKKSTRANAVDQGSHSANGPGVLSKSNRLSTRFPNSSPPKIPNMDEIDFADSSLVAGLERAFGTKDLDSICRLISQVLPTDPRYDLNEPDSWNSLLATLHDIAPRDALEGLLAVQMVGVHETAMRFLNRAIHGSPTSAEVDVNTNLAVKLLRTFTAQMEALNRHRGKITPPMVVGSVNVNDGGQAIVGSVNHPGPGKISKDGEKEKAG